MGGAVSIERSGRAPLGGRTSQQRPSKRTGSEARGAAEEGSRRRDRSTRALSLRRGGQIEGTQDAGQLEPGEPLATVTTLPAVNLLSFLNMVFDPA